MRVRPLSPWIWSAARPGIDWAGNLAARCGSEGCGDQARERDETQEAGPARIRQAVGQSTGTAGDPPCRQAGSGMARSRARAETNWVSQGQRRGRCRVSWRALRVILPARERKRRRRVLVVATVSPRAMRWVQRARLWAMTCTASQAPLAGKRPEGRWFRPSRTSGPGWRSRSRRGGGGQPPVPGYSPPGR